MSDVSTIRLGSIASFEMGQSPPSSVVVDGDGGVPFLQGCAEFGPHYPQPHCSCLRPPKVCKEGDVLISVRAPVGTINKADRAYCIGRGLAAVRLSEGYPENYGWHLLGYWAPDLRRVAQGTTFEAVGRDDLANLEIIGIAPEDRAALVAILDAADKTIANTEALIGKLKQIKTGLLHDLLTRGMEDHGQLRDPVKNPEHFKNSPLGRIPKAWRTVLLGELADVIVGGTPSTAVASFWGGDIPWMSSGDVHQRYILDVAGWITEKGLASSNAKLVDPPSVVIALAGQGKTRGTVAMALSRLCGNQSVAFLKPRDSELSAYYLFHNLDIRYEELRSRSAGGGRAGLSKGILENIPVPVPEPKEQETISKILNTADEAIAKTDASIAKLKAMKKGLMHDLLTGRVRVPRKDGA